MASRVEERLCKLLGDINSKYAGDYAVLIREATDETSFMEGMSRLAQGGGTRFQGDFNQMIGPLFSRLYREDERVRTRVYEVLKEFNLPNEVVDEHFFKRARISVNLSTRVGLLDKALGSDEKVRVRFGERANQLMLDYLKAYLESAD